MKNWLIDDARTWWKLASAQLAIVGGAIVAAVVADPTIIKQTLDALPADLRPLVPPVAGAIAAALPIIVRLWRQAPPAPRPGDQA